MGLELLGVKNHTLSSPWHYQKGKLLETLGLV